MPSLPLDVPSSSYATSTSPIVDPKLSYTGALLASLNPLPSSPAHSRRLSTLRSLCVRSVRIKILHDVPRSTPTSTSARSRPRRRAPLASERNGRRNKRGGRGGVDGDGDEEDEGRGGGMTDLLVEEESTLGKAQLPIRIRPMAVVANVLVLAGLGVLGFHPSSSTFVPLLNDKALHFLAFLLSTLLFYLIFDVEEHARRSSSLWRRMPLLLTALTCFLVGGIGSEIVQGWLPYKTFDPYDILFNLLGSTLGLVIAYHVEARYRIRREIALLYDPIDMQDYEDEEDYEEEEEGDLFGIGQGEGASRTRSFEMDLEHGRARGGAGAGAGAGIWDNSIDDGVWESGGLGNGRARDDQARPKPDAGKVGGRRVRFDEERSERDADVGRCEEVERDGDGRDQGKNRGMELFAIEGDEEEEEAEEGQVTKGKKVAGQGLTDATTQAEQEDADVWR